MIYDIGQEFVQILTKTQYRKRKRSWDRVRGRERESDNRISLLEIFYARANASDVLSLRINIHNQPQFGWCF